MRVQSTTRLDGDTAYHTDTLMHVTAGGHPADKDIAHPAGGKWIGACAADMRPGDMTSDNGLLVDLKKMMGL